MITWKNACVKSMPDTTIAVLIKIMYLANSDPDTLWQNVLAKTVPDDGYGYLKIPNFNKELFEVRVEWSWDGDYRLNMVIKESEQGTGRRKAIEDWYKKMYPAFRFL